MNYIDKIVFRMFKTLTDKQKYDLLEKLTLENKELKEQLSICDVGCSKISDEQKQKAYDSAVRLVNEIFDW